MTNNAENRNGRERELAREMVRSYYRQLFLYVAGLMVLFTAGYLWGSSRIWYGSESIYPLIHFIHENWLVSFCVCVLAGTVYLSWKNFRRAARVLEHMLDAVGRVADGQEGLVELPEELRQTEAELNRMVLQMRENESRAREAEQRKNDLIVYMAHDLKTPLTSVIGYLSLLEEEQGISPELRQKYIGIAKRKSMRLEELINEFFEITRFNLSTMSLELSSVNLTRMLEQICFEFTPLFQEKDLVYRLDCEDGLELICDVDKLQRVLDNLLRNVVNYSYEHTEVLVTAKRQLTEDRMEIRIRNHGRTIPEEKRKRIFEQFFRLESSRGTKSGGAGLGLAIAKEIVERHGGSLTCESENETITFVVALPLSGMENLSTDQS